MASRYESKDLAEQLQQTNEECIIRWKGNDVCFITCHFFLLLGFSCLFLNLLCIGAVIEW